MPGWITESCEFAEPETSYLEGYEHVHCHRSYPWLLGELTLQHVKADAPQFIDIWMVNLCQEADLWGGHRVVVGEEELELEDTPWNSMSATASLSLTATSMLATAWAAHLHMETTKGRGFRRRNIGDCPREALR